MPVISTNLAAEAALTALNATTSKLANQLSQLASGSRIIQASDDASGLAVGSQLLSDVTVFRQNAISIDQGSAILRSADGALAAITAVLFRMLSLAAEGSSAQLTNLQRGHAIDVEYQLLKKEILSIVDSTTYSGQALLTGSFLSNVKFLIGTRSTATITVSIPTVDGRTLVASSLSTAAQALAALGVLNSAMALITDYRAQVGAYQSRFDFSGRDIATNLLSLTAAAAVILDADIAAVKARTAALNVANAAAIAALSQAARLPGQLLTLIQSAPAKSGSPHASQPAAAPHAAAATSH